MDMVMKKIMVDDMEFIVRVEMVAYDLTDDENVFKLTIFNKTTKETMCYVHNSLLDLDDDVVGFMLDNLKFDLECYYRHQIEIENDEWSVDDYYFRGIAQDINRVFYFDWYFNLLCKYLIPEINY